MSDQSCNGCGDEMLFCGTSAENAKVELDRIEPNEWTLLIAAGRITSKITLHSTTPIIATDETDGLPVLARAESN